MPLPAILATILALIVLATVAAGIAYVLPLWAIYVCAVVGIGVAIRKIVRVISRMARLHGTTR